MCILISGLIAEDIGVIAEGTDYGGSIGIEGSYFHHDIADKRNGILAVHFKLHLNKSFENGQLVVKFKGILDSEDKSRRYVDFNDFYYKHKFENSDLQIGRSTRFWGAMEFYNSTDIFNTKDWLADPLDFDSKLGAWNIAYTKYFNDDEFSIIIKVHEENQAVQDNESVYNIYYPFPYDDNLITQESRNRPSVFLKYSGNNEDMQLDYSFIYENGYDEQRYISLENGKLRQNAYLVNKLLGFATFVSGSTIYKTELSYTLSDNEYVSDYAQLGIGFEHTLSEFLDNADLGLLVEYYRYKSFDDTKLGAQELDKLFANDLTFAFRFSMNDVGGSEVLGGMDLDFDNKEKIFFISYDTRVSDTFKLEFSYRHLRSDLDSLFQGFDHVKAKLNYYW